MYIKSVRFRKTGVMIREKIYRQIDQASVVSFDLFGTLVEWPYVRSEDLYEHIGQIYGERSFAGKRRSAEREYYRKRGAAKEAQLADIYGMMPEYSHLMQREIEMTLHGVRAREEYREVYDYARRAGKRIVLCSDMYLPQQIIEEMLQMNGIEGYERLFLSNAVNRRKDRGDMYEYMVSELGVRACRILHIGDNEKSDGKRAEQYGLSTCLAEQAASGLRRRDRRYRSFYSSHRGDTGASVAVALAAQKRDTGNYWEEFGYRYAGPFVYSYARWIGSMARRRGLRKVLFAARDGYLVEKALRMIDQGVETAYVYAPRMLSYTAYLDYDKDEPEQADAVCRYFGKETGEMCGREYIEQHAAEFAALAEEEERSCGYREYIDSVIGGECAVGVVDSVSMRLSAQRLIERVSGVHTVGLYVRLLPRSGAEEAVERYEFSGGAMDDFYGRSAACHFTELIFSSPEPPIVTMRQGRPVYADRLSEDEIRRCEICREIEKGVMAFVRDIRARFLGHDVYITARHIATLMRQYMSAPESGDRLAMHSVTKATGADNCEYIPLFAADFPFWNTRKTRKLVWPTFAQRMGLLLLRPVSVKSGSSGKTEINLLPYLHCKLLELTLLGRIRIKLGA